MNKPTYDAAFYSTFAGSSLSSAREIVSVVRKIIDPKSVVDVGCGIGTWLRAWTEVGVDEVIGIDGSYVRLDQLLIPTERFRPIDLTGELDFKGKFDLVESLEVGEHLLESKAAGFVRFLCSLGDMVLFSAAIPNQEGTDHINEQWPEYWAGLFESNGFVVVDVIRDLVWNNPKVACYYAQNVFLFVRRELRDSLNLAGILAQSEVGAPLARVHPKLWVEKYERPLDLGQAIRMLPKSFGRFRSKWAKRLHR